MAQIKVRYFVEKPNDDGTIRFYWQPWPELQALGWKTERLRDKSGRPFSTPAQRGDAIARAEELNARLDAWREGSPDPTAASTTPATPNIVRLGTLAHLIRHYKASDDFKDLGEKTKRAYQQNMEVLEEWGGDFALVAIGPARVQALYKAFKKRTPAKARAIVGMLRILLAYAIRAELLAKAHGNAAEKPKMQGAKPSGIIWPIDAVALFVEVADRMGWHSIGTAVMVNHWLGQREADILELEPEQYRDGRFWIDQNKTGAFVAVPHSSWVQARVEAELQRQRDRGIKSITHLILCETTGQPWKEDHFRHTFADIRDQVAEIWPAFEPNHGELKNQKPVPADALQFMHLRHTAVTELAIAGSEVPEIAGVTGHTIKSVESILDRYLVRTSALAKAAMDKRQAQCGELVEIFATPAKSMIGHNKGPDLGEK